MPVEIRLPQLGESIHEGTVARWLKRPGDRVEKYEPLAEITTDKVNVEMPSPLAGVLVELLVPEGETRPVGAPIALIETGASPETAGIGEAPAAQGTVPVVAPAVRPPARVRLSPLVRKLAEEHGLPESVLETLTGSGAGGRITKDDVLRYLASAGRAGEEVVKLSPIRRTIAQRMAQSKREIPHAYGVIEVDMQAVVAWREAHKEAWRAREGAPLTYTAFFVRAACEALRAHPIVNSSWTDEGILVRKRINIGIGIAVPDGLVVPVIRHADQLSLAGVARALDDLTARARAGRLGLDDIQGGTFTITNPGVFGSIWSMPIILPGQAAILATDAIIKRAVVRDDAIAIRPIMHLGLSFDHRIFDGATAMQFLNVMKAWFEDYRDGR
ncbi:MAG: dihydrolipoamide acetyltransferase family protein [Armatimonadota bacterium]|nr:dihydrolipoamide acetyltransferase family protein [Armatimonadota bacterium]